MFSHVTANVLINILITILREGNPLKSSFKNLLTSGVATKKMLKTIVTTFVLTREVLFGICQPSTREYTVTNFLVLKRTARLVNNLEPCNDVTLVTLYLVYLQLIIENSLLQIRGKILEAGITAIPLDRILTLDEIAQREASLLAV
jgi:hypothetical protein